MPSPVYSRQSLLTGIYFIVLLLTACTAPKLLTKADIQALDNIKAHIQYLADDKLEGRRTGTNGEKLAMEYISGQFRSIGLLPKGNEDYYQAFEVNEGKQINPSTRLSINGNALETGKDFFPFPFSPAQTIDALPAIAVKEPDMPWFIDLKEILEENKSNSHFDLPGYIQTTTRKDKEKKASAIIFYNTSDIDDKLVFDNKDRSANCPIPVLYVAGSIAKKYFKDPSATLNIKLKTDIGEKKRVGHNVIGYIDNGAATIVVLGAHFDHLGYGEDGNSMLRTGEHLIHNGADDNASGSAALIELARELKTSKAKNNNYLFIAFSGEELGLFGSKYFTEHPTIDLKKVDYMINMDMVGRLNDSSKVITIGGYGTSPTWKEVFFSTDQNRSKLKETTIVFKFDSSGTGPSDHTSFYRKDIPVLFILPGCILIIINPQMTRIRLITTANCGSFRKFFA